LAARSAGFSETNNVVLYCRSLDANIKKRVSLEALASMKKLSEMMAEAADGDAATESCASSLLGRTSSDSSTLSLMIPRSYYDNRWMKAAKLLRTDPSLMTGKILITALKNKAPLSVIKFFLSVNPKAAGIPKEGPTPLQVAVQHNASKEVVEELIAACPFALIVTTSAEWLDPLSYARRFRSSEMDLIALLSRPLGRYSARRGHVGPLHFFVSTAQN
jgi:hypothetical protein